MENWIKKKDYAILIYSQENRDCYNAAMKALNQTKKAAGWDAAVLAGGKQYCGNDL